MNSRWLPLSPIGSVLTLMVMSVLAVGGCSRPFREAPNPVEIDAREYDRVYQAAVDVLRDYGFRVNRQDHRFGRVTSHPLDSATLAEPWRPHNTTGAQAWQSTLTHLQRTVTVFIDPIPGQVGGAAAEDTADVANEPDAFHLRVEVLLENQQWPTRRLIPSEGGRMFSSLSEVPPDWRERGIEERYWRSVGRDPWLEDRLIRDIVERSLTF